MLIGYARVSTARQGESLDTQRDALLDVGLRPAALLLRYRVGQQMAASWPQEGALVHATG